METQEHGGRVAAFFDLDGTLMPLPSLERRFLRTLRDRREIPLKNYFMWLQEALKLLPHGVSAAAQANKMYLKSVQSLEESTVGNLSDFSADKSGHPPRSWESRVEGQASIHFRGRARRNPRLPVPRFFEEGVERVTCHAMLGHAIVIVTGTLEPLARTAAHALEAELARRGFGTKIRVCATRLEEMGGRWTGRISGEAMFGESKARTVRVMAEEMGLDLAQCWAYGDSAADRWMMEAVGKPAAVNPAWKLARLARKRDWPVLRWTEDIRHIEEPTHESVLQQAEPCA